MAPPASGAYRGSAPTHPASGPPACPSRGSSSDSSEELPSDPEAEVWDPHASRFHQAKMAPEITASQQDAAQTNPLPSSPSTSSGLSRSRSVLSACPSDTNQPQMVTSPSQRTPLNTTGLTAGTDSPGLGSSALTLPPCIKSSPPLDEMSSWSSISSIEDLDGLNYTSETPGAARDADARSPLSSIWGLSPSGPTDWTSIMDETPSSPRQPATSNPSIKERPLEQIYKIRRLPSYHQQRKPGPQPLFKFRG